MSEFPESAFHDRVGEPRFLSRLALAIVLVTAGVGIAMFMAAA